jgi:hypothetical protein
MPCPYLTSYLYHSRSTQIVKTGCVRPCSATEPDLRSSLSCDSYQETFLSSHGQIGRYLPWIEHMFDRDSEKPRITMLHRMSGRFIVVVFATVLRSSLPASLSLPASPSRTSSSLSQEASPLSTSSLGASEEPSSVSSSVPSSPVAPTTSLMRCGSLLAAATQIHDK